MNSTVTIHMHYTGFTARIADMLILLLRLEQV
jgi:hypothetical protein